MLDLNDIALFVQVVRSGSFAEAARRTGIPSNTVSRRIQELEAKLGLRLLQRSTRKLTLTGAGTTFHERCAGAIDGLIDAGQDMMRGTQEPNGLVRVAVPADFFDFFLMEWVADFLALYPKVRLEFVLSDANADLIADRIDVAFRGSSLVNSGYVGRQVLSEGRDGLVASPSYFSAKGSPVTLQDLVNHDCVCFSHASGYTTWRMVGLDKSDEEVRVAARFGGNTVQALRKAAVAGLGIALLPRAIVRRDLQAGLLVPVLAQYHCTGKGLSVLYPSRRQRPLAVTAFIDLVVGKFSAEDAFWEKLDQ